jgi:hypothetical protein
VALNSLNHKKRRNKKYQKNTQNQFQHKTKKGTYLLTPFSAGYLPDVRRFQLILSLSPLGPWKYRHWDHRLYGWTLAMHCNGKVPGPRPAVDARYLDTGQLLTGFIPVLYWFCTKIPPVVF